MSDAAHQRMFRATRRRGRARLCVASLVGVGLLSGCQSVSGTSVVTSQVRIIDTSPDAPAVDIYEGTAAVAYNLGFGTATSYIPLSPGVYDFSANPTGTKQVLTTARGTFAAASQYTVLISNIAASIQETIIKDQSASAPGGDVALRFLDEGTAIGAVDVYLVASGTAITAATPILTAFTFGANSGYLNFPVGAYKVVVYPTGVVPTATSVAAYTGAVVTYSSGSVRTIVLVDQKLLNAPSVQVITANDYDSPSATS